MNIGEHRHCYKDLYGKKTYRFCNLRKWKDFNKKQLTLLKMCVTSLLCGPRAGLWPFYGFLCKRFSLYREQTVHKSARGPPRRDVTTGGDSSNKGCFGRKTNLFRESGDFARNRETHTISSHQIPSFINSGVFLRCTLTSFKSTFHWLHTGGGSNSCKMDVSVKESR